MERERVISGEGERAREREKRIEREERGNRAERKQGNLFRICYPVTV